MKKTSTKVRMRPKAPRTEVSVILHTKRLDLSQDELKTIRTLVGLGLKLLEDQPLGKVEMRLLKCLELKGIVFEGEDEEKP